jgi:hypothetical protein
MSMDKLEKYIRENRESFDDKVPRSDVWHKINDQLEDSETSSIHMSTYLWRAAAIVLFVAVVWLLVDKNYRDDQDTQITRIYDEQQIEFEDVESFYMQEIEEKQKLIIQFVSDNPDVDKNLLGEIDHLDSTYQVLKLQAEEGYSEKILDAMVINLQMRIDILNQQLDVLEKIKILKENEKASI